METKKSPSYSKATVHRSDYTGHDDYNKLQLESNRATRFGATRYSTVKSILPNSSEDTADKVATSRERISYEHNFDCRKGRKERGRLHGSFVWEPVAADKIVKTSIRSRLTQS